MSAALVTSHITLICLPVDQARVFYYIIITYITIIMSADAVMQVVLTLATMCRPGCHHATDVYRHCQSPSLKFANGFSALHRLQNSLSEGYCGNDCEDSLQHMLTTHIRARYLAGQVLPNNVQSGTGGFVDEQQATVHLQHKLATLFQRYIEQKGLQRG